MTAMSCWPLPSGSIAPAIYRRWPTTSADSPTWRGATWTASKLLDALFDEHHPKEPHWQLAFLGVHPRCQNMGLGSALLKHGHDEMDTAGLHQYLEASNHNSARLYRRHGYRDMSPYEIRLPDGNSFFRMWRTTANARRRDKTAEPPRRRHWIARG